MARFRPYAVVALILSLTIVAAAQFQSCSPMKAAVPHVDESSSTLPEVPTTVSLTEIGEFAPGKAGSGHWVTFNRGYAISILPTQIFSVDLEDPAVPVVSLTVSQELASAVKILRAAPHGTNFDFVGGEQTPFTDFRVTPDATETVRVIDATDPQALKVISMSGAPVNYVGSGSGCNHVATAVLNYDSGNIWAGFKAALARQCYDQANFVSTNIAQVPSEFFEPMGGCRLGTAHKMLVVFNYYAPDPAAPTDLSKRIRSPGEVRLWDITTPASPVELDKMPLTAVVSAAGGGDSPFCYATDPAGLVAFGVTANKIVIKDQFAVGLTDVFAALRSVRTKSGKRVLAWSGWDSNRLLIFSQF